MKLKDARALLKKIRDEDEKISIRPHAWKDHPERKFAPLELVKLLQGKGGFMIISTHPQPRAPFFGYVKMKKGERPSLRLFLRPTNQAI